MIKLSKREHEIVCFDLRCQTKRGIRLHPDDGKFVEKMFNDFPEWYEPTQDDVFNATVPFGSTVKKGSRGRHA